MFTQIGKVYLVLCSALYLVEMPYIIPITCTCIIVSSSSVIVIVVIIIIIVIIIIVIAKQKMLPINFNDDIKSFF